MKILCTIERSPATGPLEGIGEPCGDNASLSFSFMADECNTSCRIGVILGDENTIFLVPHDTNSKFMSAYFTRERFGSPQAIAGLILVAFLAQCIWFCSKAPLSDRELAFILQGQQEWRAGLVAFHDQPSPITGLIAGLPVLASHATAEEVPPQWRWLARVPF